MADAEKTDDEKRRLTITYKKSIDASNIYALDFAQSIKSLVNLYEEFSGSTTNQITQLSIERISKGSFEVGFWQCCQQMLSDGIPYTAENFADELKNLYEYLKGIEKIEKIYNFLYKKIKNNKGILDCLTYLKNFIDPARQLGNSIKIGDAGESTSSINIGFHDIHRIEKKLDYLGRMVKKIIEEQEKDIEKKTGQIFRWYQVTGNVSDSRTDKGIIQEISDEPASVKFKEKKMKRTMLGEALFRKTYTVDVDVIYIKGILTRYEILPTREYLIPSTHETKKPPSPIQKLPPRQKSLL